ncbi:MAG: hypothetical protein WD512_09695, partial [Candidatus Paceibacterota bacterium]
SIHVIYPSDELFFGVLGGYGGLAIILEATISLTDNYLIQKVVNKIDANSTNNIFNVLMNLKNNNNSGIIFYNGLIYPERRHDLFNIYYVKAHKEGAKGQAVRAVRGEAVKGSKGCKAEIDANFDLCSDQIQIGNFLRDEKNVEKGDKPEKGEKGDKGDKGTRLQITQDYYWLSMFTEQILRRSKILKYCRAYLKPELDEDIKSRNWELSYDTNQHKPLLRFPTTTALQEYFIPIQKDAIELFMNEFNRITQAFNVNILNISLRYVRSSVVDRLSVVSYAPSDRLAVVIYYNLVNNPYSLSNAALWTQQILDIVLGPIVKGSYYLPYLPLARKDQFQKAYPN